MTSQSEQNLPPTFSIDDEDVRDMPSVPASVCPTVITVTASAEPAEDGEPHAYVPIDDKISAELAEERAAAPNKPHTIDVIKRQVQVLKQTAGFWGEKFHAYMEKKDAPASPAAADTVPSSIAGESHAAEAVTADTGNARSKLLAAAAERVNDLGRKSRENAAWVVHTAAESIKRLTLPRRTLRGICRHEASSRPVPQSVLLLCTAVVNAGSAPASLFQGDAHPEAAALMNQLESGKLLLLPSAIDPVVAGAALKQLLLSLEEPVLLTRLADLWVGAAGNPAAIKALLPELPVANATTLRVVAEACRHITLQQHGSDSATAADLAAGLAPALLWRVTPQRRSGVPAAISANFTTLRSRIGSVMAGTAATTSAAAVAQDPAHGPSAESGSHGEEGEAAAANPAPDTADPVARSPSGEEDLPGCADVPLGAVEEPVPCASPGAVSHDEAEHAPAGAVLPTSTVVRSTSFPLGVFGRKSGSPSADGSAGAPHMEIEPVEEEDEGGQRVALTDAELVAVASVMQVLIVDGFDLVA